MPASRLEGLWAVALHDGPLNPASRLEGLWAVALHDGTEAAEDTSTAESTPSGLISDDFTINSYSQDNLSVQHTRYGPEQVPFILGTRGPLSLRGREWTPLDNAAVVSTGDEKE
jgi:hypothetical protein